MTDVNVLTHRISEDLRELAAIMEDPSALNFDALHDGFSALERGTEKLSVIRATFAWMAESNKAASKGGTSTTVKYLVKKLGISTAEARKRLTLGEKLFAPPKADPIPDPPAPEPPMPEDLTPEDSDADQSSESETDEERRQREEAERAQREAAERERREAEERYRKMEQERAERLRKAAEVQEQIREFFKNNTISEEMLQLINRELQNLSENAQPGHYELYLMALRESGTRQYFDMVDWLHREIRKANKNAKDYDGEKDLNAALKKRRASLGNQDFDRGAKLFAYLDPAGTAITRAAIDIALKADAARLQELGIDDERTFEKRYADAIVAIMHHFLANREAPVKGVGSLLISMVADDIESMDKTDLFRTNGGDQVSPIDILRIGADLYDIGVLHDTKGQVLDLGRMKRSASLMQRIALVAAEGVCTCGDCNRPATWCDIHHIYPWASGGRTSLDNLTLQCRSHHVDNNDRRTPGINKGHMDTDPESGRAGYRPDVGEPMTFNETIAYHDSNGAKIRAKHAPPGAPSTCSPTSGSTASSASDTTNPPPDDTRGVSPAAGPISDADLTSSAGLAPAAEASLGDGPSDDPFAGPLPEGIPF